MTSSLSEEVGNFNLGQSWRAVLDFASAAPAPDRPTKHLALNTILHASDGQRSKVWEDHVKRAELTLGSLDAQDAVNTTLRTDKVAAPFFAFLDLVVARSPILRFATQHVQLAYAVILCDLAAGVDPVKNWAAWDALTLLLDTAAAPQHAPWVVLPDKAPALTDAFMQTFVKQVCVAAAKPLLALLFQTSLTAVLRANGADTVDWPITHRLKAFTVMTLRAHWAPLLPDLLTAMKGPKWAEKDTFAATLLAPLSRALGYATVPAFVLDLAARQSATSVLSYGAIAAVGQLLPAPALTDLWALLLTKDDDAITDWCEQTLPSHPAWAACFGTAGGEDPLQTAIVAARVARVAELVAGKGQYEDADAAADFVQLRLCQAVMKICEPTGIPAAWSRWAAALWTLDPWLIVRDWKVLAKVCPFGAHLRLDQDGWIGRILVMDATILADKGQEDPVNRLVAELEAMSAERAVAAAAEVLTLAHQDFALRSKLLTEAATPPAEGECVLVGEDWKWLEPVPEATRRSMLMNLWRLTEVEDFETESASILGATGTDVARVLRALLTGDALARTAVDVWRNIQTARDLQAAYERERRHTKSKARRALAKQRLDACMHRKGVRPVDCDAPTLFAFVDGLVRVFTKLQAPYTLPPVDADAVHAEVRALLRLPANDMFADGELEFDEVLNPLIGQEEAARAVEAVAATLVDGSGRTLVLTPDARELLGAYLHRSLALLAWHATHLAASRGQAVSVTKEDVTRARTLLAAGTL
jgi:hypothetical protein